MLTEEQVAKLEQDQPIDYKVAKCVDIELGLMPQGWELLYVVESGVSWGNCERWHPTSNWDQAMRVAEKVGLFDTENQGCFLRFHNGKWQVCFNDLYDPVVNVVSEDACGPRAVCLAILEE